MKVKWPLMHASPDADGLGGSTGSAPVAGESAGSGTNWEQLDSEFDQLQHSDEVLAPVTPAVPAEPPKATETPVPPTTPEVAATPPATPPVTTPTEPATPPVAAQPEVPAPPPVDRAVMRQQYLTQLERDYAVSADDAALLLTEPEKVLPRIAAQLHANVVDTVVAAVMNNLPGAITSLQKQTQASQEAETAFFSAWPQLNKPEYSQTVKSAVIAYRNLNPTASREEVMRAAGLSALITLRLPIPPELLTQQQSAPAPAAPFSPAAPGASAGPAGTPQPPNQFTQLAAEFLDDDRG